MEKQLVKRFKKYVMINSESGNEKEFSDILASELNNLGFKVIKDKKTSNHKSNTSNIIAFLKGSRKKDPIILSAHMDTVKPGIDIVPKEKNGIIYSESNTILGADDKAGIAIILETINYLISNSIEHRPIEVVFTVHEESGLYGAKALDYSLLKSKKAIVLDSSGTVGGIVITAPSKEKITAKIIGKAAHAGISPDKGINAISVVSEAISEMNLSKIDNETTANIGTVKGGNSTNIIPNEVKITGEVRSFKNSKRKKQINHMKKCINKSIKKYKASAKITTDLLYKGYNLSKNDPFVEEIISAGKKANINMFTRKSSGGSDANVFNENNIKTINLVIGTQKAHTTKEFISIKSLTKCSRILLEILKI